MRMNSLSKDSNNCTTTVQAKDKRTEKVKHLEDEESPAKKILTS